MYCEDAFDIILFQNLGKFLAPIQIIAKNSTVRKKLKTLGYKVDGILPSYPDVVLMFRNMAWKFPCKKIVKIGFKHGAYNFKAHSKAEYYNMFNIFFLTSQDEINRVRHTGVKIELQAAYPKVDSFFDGSINEKSTKDLAYNMHLSPTKKTLLFASTWDKSGMSAIEKWYKHLHYLKPKYNIIVTVHEWMSQKYVKDLKKDHDIHFITEFDRLKYIALADVCINDTSSLIAETILLKKPLVTFTTNKTERSLNNVLNYIEEVSIQIDNFFQLEPAIEKLLKNPYLFLENQTKIAKIFFDDADGSSGRRAAERIIEIVPELHL
ncbi:MAG: CDP-glycerol glycerophosphotransferase family protein [Candidatus Cloacimonetes bacterium]|nr:CDP-glycerol glycerophosphotransferase family protein [Candidatus Cloacimonadota bacterium]